MNLNDAFFDEQLLVGRRIHSVTVLEESKIGDGDEEDLEGSYFETEVEITLDDGTKFFAVLRRDYFP